MPLISNHLRLLFSPSLFLSPLKPSFSLLSKRNPNFLSTFTILSSSSRKPRNTPHPYTNRRKITTFEETTIQEQKGLLMEKNTNDSVAGFNKKRAEGNDKSAKIKNLQLKVRTLNPSNTISYVQILGTGLDTQDTSPSILLFFDKQRFIFNAGEGLQRFCTEHKIKLSKIDHIFLSRVCSETAGGLPGLLLTLAGMGDEGMSVNIWGPSDFKYLLDAMKSFIPRAAMVHTHSFGSSSSSDEVPIPDPGKLTVPITLIDDEVIKLSAILLRPSCSSESQLNQESLLLHPPKEKPGDLSVIYICKLPEIMGKFDPKKAADCGLKAGPKYRELQLGNRVMSDNKTKWVEPCDVMDPSIPGPIVFVVDCPTESHLEELLSLDCLSDYYADSSIKPLEGLMAVNCIIHLSPGRVTATTNYQKWMKRFGAAQHVMAGHERKNVEIPILKSSARIAARLNYLCPQFFPAPGFWSIEHLNNPAPDTFASSEVSMCCESISAQNLLKFHLRPYAQLGLDRSHIPSLSSASEIIDELHSEIPEIADAAQQVSQLWKNVGETKEKTLVLVQDSEVMIEEPWLDGNALPSCLENITREDMEVVLLGTGSSQPSKYRNVSSIYINLFAKGGLLLDCGEGSLGQLIRRYGVDGADDAVRALNCIWISHIHADHHTGLARILARRRQLLKDLPHKPLLVIGPRQLKRYLDAYQRLENLDMLFLDCRETMEASEDDDENTTLFTKGSRMQSYRKRPRSPGEKNAIASILENMKKMLSKAGLEALVSFSVVHCPEAFGVSITAAERVNSVGKVIPGWKIVYSGDTRPCPELIKASHGATVLIHEATFEDGLLEEAIARNHSTTKEAIEVGESAGVYRIILTHFSQRYPKIPVFDEAHMHKTCIAFDMMSINIADLPVLPKVLPYLKLLFKNEMIVDDSDMIVDELDDISASAAAT